jgi:hypothetical protein
MEPTRKAYLAARYYWRYLTFRDLYEFWKHYTTGKGAGIYGSVGPSTSFREYVVNSACETEHERVCGI